MTAICLFTDEDIYGAIAPLLRQVGFDAVSTPESGRRGESDESQLAWATDQQRTLISFNVAHYALLHAMWMGAGKEHAGIVVSSQRPLSDLLRRMIHLLNNLDAAAIANRLEYLSQW